MELYLVIMCPKCATLRYAKITQKTAICFMCSYKIPINSEKIRILYKAESVKEAIKALQLYKIRFGNTRDTNNQKNKLLQ